MKNFRNYLQSYKNRFNEKSLLYLRQLIIIVSALGKVLKKYSSKITDSVFTLTRFLAEVVS